MSAITVIYTTTGFVLAADSLQVGSDGSRDLSAQKIFPAGDPDSTNMAYGLAGTVRIISDETGETQIDFLPEMKMLMEQLVNRQMRGGLLALMNAVAGTLQGRLQHILDTDNSFVLPPTPGKSTGDGSPDSIVSLLFCGYPSSGTPEFGAVTLMHQSQKLLEPVVQTFALGLGGLQGFVSKTIADGLFNPASQSYHHKGLRRYRTFSQEIPAARSLDDALELAMAYFAACNDPQVRKLDEGHCDSVGGNIVAATITPTGKFQWISSAKIHSFAEKFRVP
jgi:hypothetical protein